MPWKGGLSGLRAPRNTGYMGKDYSSKKYFDCLICNGSKTVKVEVYKKIGLGSLKCSMCGAGWQSEVTFLCAEVDVFSDWVDACEEAAMKKVRQDEKANGKAAVAREKKNDEQKIKIAETQTEEKFVLNDRANKSEAAQKQLRVKFETEKVLKRKKAVVENDEIPGSTAVKKLKTEITWPPKNTSPPAGKTITKAAISEAQIVPKIEDELVVAPARAAKQLKAERQKAARKALAEKKALIEKMRRDLEAEERAAALVFAALSPLTDTVPHEGTLVAEALTPPKYTPSSDV